MVMLLQERYPRCFEALEPLCGGSVPSSTLERLNEIYLRTENIWTDYVSMIPHGAIRYLLFAEAPPWSESGRPKYVLDPESKPKTLMRALSQAFFDRPTQATFGTDKILRRLAERGFLIVDTLPFAIDYSLNGRRQRKAYKTLVAASCSTYVREKLETTGLKWSEQLRIAFGFKMNARTVINALDGRITLGGTIHYLAEDQIAVTGANYPDGRRLRELYRIKQ
jgi:hypothetical protein